MASEPRLSISCHCGAAEQTVRLRDQSSSAPQEINLCHCTACRHNTGLMCVSHAGIECPDSIEGLREYYSTTKTITRFFCATCGCHVFWRLQSPLTDDADSQVRDGARTTAERTEWWAVATGVIIGFLEEGEQDLVRFTKHINTAGTTDGGLGPFIRDFGGSQGPGLIEKQGSPPPSSSIQPAEEKLEDSNLDVGVDIDAFSQGGDKGGREEEVLKAFCHCRTVQFHVTRPNDASKLPRSNYPDLMVPYCTGSPQIQNPEDSKWWLRPELRRYCIDTNETLPTKAGRLRRYLAGTCACRSCRLTSGFEIQTWAFIPRANIFFHIHESRRDPSIAGPWTTLTLNESNEEADIVPLDFATLPPGILTSYESSQGVRREFCSRCGATVFWRDRWRPELMDVSVGLLDAPEGARAESWLDWWTGRVSFAEDAGNGRTGEMSKHARSLIGSLEDGLRRYQGQG